MSNAPFHPEFTPMEVVPDPLPTDAGMFPRLGSGDAKVRDEAWRQFDRLYTPLLRKWADTLGHRGDDNDELVQLVKTEFHKQSQTFIYDPGKGRFRALLKTILRLQGANLARQRVRHRGTGGADPMPEIADGTNLDATLDAAWEVEVLHEAVGVLEKRYAASRAETHFEAFRRTSMGNESPASVARALGISIDLVYQHKSRVLRQLKATVQQLTAEMG